MSGNTENKQAENKNPSIPLAVQEKIKRYLNDYPDLDFYTKFDDKYCLGIIFLWFYIRWLQAQEQQKSTNYYAWFESTIKLFDDWFDGKRLMELGIGSKEAIERGRFIDLLKSTIELFDNFDTERRSRGVERHESKEHNEKVIDKILGDDTPINQTAMEKNLSEDVSESRKLENEYSIVSLLTLDQLKELLETKDIIQDGRLILIDSHERTTALFKKDKQYHYFDPSNKISETQTDSIDELAKLIFKANFYTVSGGRSLQVISTTYTCDKPSPLGFRMFSLDEKQAATYPNQKDVLGNINPVLKPEKGYANECSGLMLAAKIGSLESVQYFLDKGVSPNTKDTSGWTALMYGAYRGYYDIVKALLDNPHTDPNIQNENGYTAITVILAPVTIKNTYTDPDIQKEKSCVALMAILEPDILYYPDVIELLISHKNVDVNIGNNNGWTALMLASRSGYIYAVELLLANKDIDVNVKTNDGWTALMLACVSKYGYYYFDIVKLLLANKDIDINIKNKDGNTALTLASKVDNVDTVAVIVKKLFANKHIDFNEQTENGWTALTLAAWYGDADMARKFLANENAAVNTQCERGMTAIMIASEKGHLSIVNMLLVNPDIDYNKQDRGGKNALMHASAEGHLDVVKSLLKHTDPNKQDKNGRTALMLASDVHCSEKEEHHQYNGIIKSLLTHPDIDPNIQDENGYTALMLAVFNGRTKAVEQLLKHKNISPNLCDKKGCAALIMAVMGPETRRTSLTEKERLAITKTLLTHPNIDHNIRDERGSTVLILASQEGYGTIVKELLANPAVDINAQDNDKATALMYAACDKEHLDIIKMFLAKQNIDINAQADGGWTAFMGAAWCGNISIIKEMLMHPKIDINKLNNDGCNALMLAASENGKGNLVVVKELLTHTDINPNPNLKTKDGKTAFDRAASDEVKDEIKNFYKSTNCDRIFHQN